MYSTAFWCLIVVYWFFWLYYVTTVTPFIERSEGWSLGSVDGVLDQSQQECRFFRRNTNPLQTFQLQPKKIAQLKLTRSHKSDASLSILIAELLERVS